MKSWRSVERLCSVFFRTAPLMSMWLGVVAFDSQ